MRRDETFDPERKESSGNIADLIKESEENLKTEDTKREIKKRSPKRDSIKKKKTIKDDDEDDSDEEYDILEDLSIYKY